MKGDWASRSLPKAFRKSWQESAGLTRKRRVCFDKLKRALLRDWGPRRTPASLGRERKKGHGSKAAVVSPPSSFGGASW